MKNISQILALLCSIPGFTFAYVLFKDGTDFSVSSKFGEINLKAPTLARFNEDIAGLKSPDKKSVEKLDSWKEILEFSQIKSIEVDILGSGKASYYLISFISDEKTVPSKNKQYKLIKDILSDMIFYDEPIQLENLEAGILENSAAAVLYTDKNGKKIFANSFFNEIFELSGKEPPNYTTSGLQFYDAMGKALNKDEYPYIYAALRNESVSAQKLFFRAEDKSEKRLIASSLLIRDESGQPEYVLTTFLKLSENLDTEQSIKEAAESASSVLYSIDTATGDYLYISRAVKNLLGISADEMNRQKLKALRKIHPAYFPRFKLFTDELRKGKAVKLDYALIDSNGGEIFVRNSGFPVKEGDKVVRIAGTISDFSDIRKVQSELLKSEERFNLLIETADDLIFTLNSSGYFSTINESGSAVLGYRSNEVTGKHFLEFVGEKGKAKVAIAFQKILNSDHVTSFEVEFVDKMRKSVMMEVQAQPLKSSGEITGMLGIGHNITDRIKSEGKLKELNAKLIEANRIIAIERDRAQHQIAILEELGNLKNEFISNVSHELRTPLASIVGFAETIASDPDLPRDMIVEFNEIMLTEGKRLAKLINDVLDFSRVEAGEEGLNISDFDVIEVLNEIGAAYRVQAEEKGLTFNNQTPEAEIIISADKDRISRVFGNLFSNAVKFTEMGGIITVIAQDFLKEVEIIITDTGIGIPENEIPQLFEKFQKVNHPGSQLPGAGFGLAVVKQIIDLHKGLIQVKSELKKGTTVIIRLPKK